MKVKIITHYLISDKKFSGDYFSKEIFIDGKKIITYGDGYHDQGKQKVDGFLDCLEWLHGSLELEEIFKADIKE